ncbi:MAG: metallophosphoesterase [Clostridiales bacterium]|nr:metallophosphoesterase [Clostridiales bacterium]
MSLFAIGDLHLSGGEDKPMDVFGPQWDRHFLRIRENWKELVKEEDTVLIPGDISWAMQLEAAKADLEEIGRLPGKKILCKGNHDYWWNSISQVRSALPDSMTALQHNAADLGDAVVCATRGWMIPTKEMPLSDQDAKICRREADRLRMALDDASARAGGRPVIVMTHYPPLLAGETNTVFTEILEAYGVHTAVYGHLHGTGIQAGFTGEYHGIRYHLVSCDSIGFSPKKIDP